MVPDVYLFLTGDDQVFTLEMKLRTGDSAQLVLKYNSIIWYSNSFMMLKL